VRVCVASAGRFHAFDLARQMARLGHLDQLYTAYPRFKVDGLPPDKVSTFPWLMGPAMFAARLGFAGLQDRLNMSTIETFDRWMAARLEPCGVFHCLSQFGTYSHRTARERFGALCVCDRGSAHILYQDEILRDECARMGAPYAGPDPRLVARELAEYDFCDLIALPSRFSMQSFVEHGVPREKLRLVPYGVDLDMFRPLAKTDKVFRVIYAGAISIRKGVSYLLEAVAGARIPGLETWLVGNVDPEMRPVLARYEGSFRHVPAVARQRLPEYYAQGSVFVIASIEEGLALVQAQAMACGLPVIATTNSGAEDLFTDGVEGFIVPIRDAEALREKIVFLYEHPEARERMAAAALDRVRSLGGWDDYGDRMAACYQGALAARDACLNANPLR